MSSVGACIMRLILKMWEQCIIIYVSIHFVSGFVLVSKSTGIIRDIIPNMHKAPFLHLTALGPQSGVKKRKTISQQEILPAYAGNTPYVL